MERTLSLSQTYPLHRNGYVKQHCLLSGCNTMPQDSTEDITEPGIGKVSIAGSSFSEA